MAEQQQHSRGPDDEDEAYETLDLTAYARTQQWWSTVFGSHSGPIAEKYSVATQIMMGGASGCPGGVSESQIHLPSTKPKPWRLKLCCFQKHIQECVGYLFQRVGKVAATAVGGGFLLLQIANHSGYVQVDWKKVEKDVNKAKRRLKKKANKAAPEINTFIEEATEFVKKNIVVSSGFVGGFLLGLAS
ncbi:FUN14 domain-containing protein 1-like isoform X1 [Puntigrus tetrazona]|uniref:FUN14 domain-containing protein 1-like isoform X1 n=1 Tax=Puntigrus tetrazona TaxID=1606681 RepID=UPI001C89677B|nr:FUN14 domain-containing protein 1-like isoform X1 [Puntigrus tetrazona]